MIKRYVILLTTACMLTLSTGCASFMSYKSSQKEIIRERAYASGDAEAIKAVNSGRFTGIGIDVSNTEALTRHPVRQLGAALLDAAVGYGAYELLQNVTESTSDSNNDSSITVTGNDNSSDGNTTTIVIGDNNQSNDAGSDNSEPPAEVSSEQSSE